MLRCVVIRVLTNTVQFEQQYFKVSIIIYLIYMSGVINLFFSSWATFKGFIESYEENSEEHLKFSTDDSV